MPKVFDYNQMYIAKCYVQSAEKYIDADVLTELLIQCPVMFT